MEDLIKSTTWKMKNLEFSSNCIVCYLDFPRRVTFFIHPLQGYCRHNQKNYHGKPYFGKSKYTPYLMVISNSLFLMASIAIAGTSWFQCEKFNTRCIVSLNWVCLVIVADFLSKCCSINFNSRLEELNGLADIFENRKYYGIKNLICHSCGENMLRNQKRFIYGVLFGGFMTILLGAIFNDGSWNSYQIVCIITSIASQTFLLFSIRYKLLIKTKIYRSISKHLMNNLNRLQNDSKNNLNYTELKRILHLYLELLKFHQHLNDFLNPSLLGWLAASSFMTVVNVYILITMIETTITFEFIYAVLGSSVSCFILDYIMTSYERFTLEVRMSRFIFQYQIK